MSDSGPQLVTPPGYCISIHVGPNFYKYGVSTEELPIGLKKCPTVKVGEINYVNTWDTSDMAEHLPRMKNLQLRDDDVILLGYPRSGNHWAFEIISMILRGKAEYITDDFFIPHLIEFHGDKLQTNVDSWKSPRLISTHCPITDLPEQVFEKKLKIIQLVRNPKDVMCSLFKFSVTSVFDMWKYDASFSDFVDLEISNKGAWGSNLNHLLATEKFTKENPDQPIFFRSFEKGKNNAVMEIRSLCRFLNRPESLAEDIAGLTSFEAMKKGTQSKMGMVDSKFFEKGGGILQKGISGSWKEQFTVEKNEEFNEHFRKMMEGTKIGALLDEYM